MESQPSDLQPNPLGARYWRERATEQPEETPEPRWRTWEPARPYLWLLGAVMFGGLVGAGLGLVQ
jgi:hypothetical protein